MHRASAAGYHARLSGVGLFHVSTTSSMRPICAMLLLNVLMYHCGVLLGPSAACCESTKTSNQSMASAASARPSKKIKIASSVCENGLLHTWLMNHVAGPTYLAVAASAASASITLQRSRDDLGRKYIFSNCDVVTWLCHASPNSVFSHLKYSNDMP